MTSRIREDTGNWKMSPLDRTLRRIRFERSCGPVVEETKEWWSPKSALPHLAANGRDFLRSQTLKTDQWHCYAWSPYNPNRKCVQWSDSNTTRRDPLHLQWPPARAAWPARRPLGEQSAKVTVEWKTAALWELRGFVSLFLIDKWRCTTARRMEGLN